MRAFFHAEQHLHDPKQFMRVGRIADPTDLPSRTEALIGALARKGITPETPQDFGTAPALTIHKAHYLDFLATAYERWVKLPNAGPEVLPNVSPYWNGSPDRDGRPPCRTSHIVAEAGYYLGDLAVPIGPHTWRSALRSTHTAPGTRASSARTGPPASAISTTRPSPHSACARVSARWPSSMSTPITATARRRSSTAAPTC